MGRRSKKKPPPSLPSVSAVKNSSDLGRWNDWLLAGALIIVTLAAYFPAWNGQALWDDDGHMTKPALRSVTGLARIWIEPGATQQYYPLVHSFFWFEHRLWGDGTLGYHLVNILLHAVSALLLVGILRKLEVPGAWLAGALFALHPVQVESVAWISELKNTLSGFFYLSSGLVYLKFDQRRERQSYALALGLFLLGLLAKSAIATLPAALLVVFWWKRGKLSWRNDVLPLTPFFVLSMLFGLFTGWMERKFIGAQGSEFNFSLIERTLIAGRAIWFYLSKLLWPQNLIFIYPRWQISQANWWQYLFPLATLGLLASLWWLRKRSRAPLAVLLLFIGTLFPALGYVNIYPFTFSFVADHFQYLACIAPLSLAAAAISYISRGIQFRLWTVQVPCGILLAALGVLTWQQSTMYADMKTLWETTIARNPDCWMAYSNRGFGLLQEGRLDAAILDFESALRAKPDYAYAQNNLGEALLKEGRAAEAIPHFKKALEDRPDYAEPYDNLGVILFQNGQLDAAISNLEKATKINPAYGDAHFNLGIALQAKGDWDAAISHFERSVEIKPDDAEAHRGLGVALIAKGRYDEAIGQFQNAVTIKPAYADAIIDLANALVKAGRPAEAAGQFRRALAFRPDDESLRHQIEILSR